MLQLGSTTGVFAAADAAPACQQVTAAPQKLLLQTGMKAFRTSSLKRQQWQQSASCARQASSLTKTTSGCQATGNKQSWVWVQLGLQGRGPRQQGRKPPAILQRRAAQALQQHVKHTQKPKPLGIFAAVDTNLFWVVLKNCSIFTCLKMSENDQKWIFFDLNVLFDCSAFPPVSPPAGGPQTSTTSPTDE